MSSVSVHYFICPRCSAELRKGVRLCHGCDATVRSGPPWPWTITALLPSAWLALASHWLFYDSYLLSVLLGCITFGGLWSLLSIAFADRCVVKPRSA